MRSLLLLDTILIEKILRLRKDPLDLTRAQLAVLKNKRDDHGVRSSLGFIDVLMGNYRKRVCDFFHKHSKERTFIVSHGSYFYFH